METTELSWVRILHAAPDFPGLNLFFDNAPEPDEEPRVARLSYGQISDYVQAPTSLHHLRGFPAARHDLGPELLSAPLAVRVHAGEHHTMIIAGRVPEVHALLLYDETEAPAPGMAKLRVVHVAPDAPAMDIGVSGERPIFANVGLEEATPFREISAATLGLEARPIRETRSVLSIPCAEIEPDAVNTLVVMGLLAPPPPVKLLAIVDVVRMAKVEPQPLPV